ncbi:MAG: type II secretion system secretin GspD [Deltaproteobacteria bacterium]|nr:type II secretion system secretin GspD [Deltaproteobacteria bacterium]MBW2339635.1 type II secretion system secretin GspD [Deltaproteobacteria bacterium]
MCIRMRFSPKSILYLLWIGLIVLGNYSAAPGARLSGEEGVTPVAPEPKPAVERPAQAKPSVIKRRLQPQKKVVPRKQITQERKVAKGEVSDERYVTIDFDNVDIVLFIKFISELTGKNFVIDKAVRGKVTIISPTKISVKEAYKVFESVLEVHGFTTVVAGNIIKVVPALHARSKNIETRLRQQAITPEDKVVTQLIPLEYANPDELRKLFAPLISKSSVIVSYPPTRMLIITDVLSNIRRLLRIVREIDVVGIGEEISVIPLEHARASDMATSLGNIFQQAARRPTRKGARVVPISRIVADQRTNCLIILATEDDTVRIKKLIELLDKEIPRGEGDIHVYYLNNANAEELVKVLMAIPPKATEAPKKGKAPVISREVQIVADKATNSLVIMAKKDDFLVLEEVIKKLDVARRMVYIEALFMEVDVSKSFELGVEWQAAETIGSHDGRDIAAFGASTLGTSIFPGVDSGTGIVRFATGFSLGVLGEAISIGGVSFPNIGAVIRAYKTDSDVHILSTPQIMTTDNEEAEILVVKNIPYLTRQETSQAGFDYSNYEYKDVGVTLNITPQINQERFVRLKITQEVSQVIKEESALGLPTTLKRVTKTTVVVKDGNTLVIGGLIDETLDQGRYNVPCLGGIPVLGWLFRSVSSSGGKTNLFIFLTPHIVENPEEAKEVYEEKKEQIEKIKEGVIKLYGGPKPKGQDSDAK